MLREQELHSVAEVPDLRQLVQDQALEHQLLLDPDGHGREEGPEATRGEGVIGLEQALELEEGLVVEDDRVQLIEGEPGFLEAVGERVAGERRVVALPREPLFLGRCHDLAIVKNRGCRIVVEGRDSQHS